MKKKLFILAICGFFSCLLFFGFSGVLQDKKPLTIVEYNQKVSVKDKTVLVYFSASWCAICHKMKPVIEQFDADFKTKLNIIYIDTEFDKEIAEEFDVHSLPLIMYYRNGIRQWVHVGKINKATLQEKTGMY